MLPGIAPAPTDPGMEIVSCYYGSGSEIPGLTGVYDSGVAGIGVALMNDQGQRIQRSRWRPLRFPQIRRWGMSLQMANRLSFNFDVTLELVKTSDTVPQARFLRLRPDLGLAFTIRRA